MHYELQSRHYCDFSTISVNRLKPRSYFIPYPDRESLAGVETIDRRYGSPLVKCLNGDWDFIYYENPNDLPLSFDSESLDFGRIDVPSVWQYRGHGQPMYLNVRYPFAYKPPVIPTTKPVGRYFSLLDGWRMAPAYEMNHVGLYRTCFKVSDLSKRHIISFLGVCSCIEVHVNGRFVGYSEESHNTAEFDLTDYVVEGSNEMVCVVRRWCNGTYLECQDMFRNNGIFRDVLLRMCDRNDVWDIDLKTRRKEGNGCVYGAEVSAFLADGEEISFTISGPKGRIRGGRLHDARDRNTVCQGACGPGTPIPDPFSRTIRARSVGGKATASFEGLEVQEWSAENPVLYDLYIEGRYSCIHQRVGFKTIEVQGNLYLLNGRRIKFKGVNHHDTDPRNGYCMTGSDILRDLELCKAFNIDTVRTSHYAPDPLMLELAAELGLYIVDEVDIETHGVFVHRFPPSYNRISNDPRWKSYYLSRTMGHYHRDKVLATPIIMWSLGNESGGGCNTDAAYSFFKGVSDIPVHYESAIYTRRKAYDIASRMYPPVSELHEIREGTCRTRQFMDRPYFMCEYAHAMGVGPGNIEGYWKEIYSHDGLIGGCVWEMNDHTVQGKDGLYTYGGDHGEWIHDNNFCCDGLFYPDRSPSTGAWIVRHAYRPIRLTWKGGSEFEVFNTTAFTHGSSFSMKISVSNGRRFDFIPSCGPLSRETVYFDLGEVSGDCFLNADAFDSDGRPVSTEQIALSESFVTSVGKSALPPWFKVEGGYPVIDAGSGRMTAGEPYTILFRAETDNDSWNFVKRPMRRWYREVTTVLGSKPSEGRVAVQYAIKCAGRTFLCSDLYEGCRTEDGGEGVLVTSVIHPVHARGRLPRFGKAFRLDSSFDGVRYLARCGESYIDMKEQFPVKECTAKVKDMTEPNIMPQESGQRLDARYAEISSESSKVRFTAVDKAFALSVKPYSDTELIGMRHRSDEKVSGTYVTINAFQQGIGTGSCGPYTLDEHCYDASKDYRLRFIISREVSNG